MRSSRHCRATVLRSLLVVVSIAWAGSAAAQDDDAIELRGLLSARFAHAYQMGEVGSVDLGDSQGVDTAIGFSMGDHFAFQLGFEWQTDDDFDTYYFPATFRGYSPLLFERLSLYGEFGIGLFFLEPDGALSSTDNERAAGYHAGGGLQADISENLSLIWYAKYKRGFGQVDDFESVVHGVGLQYSWGL